MKKILFCLHLLIFTSSSNAEINPDVSVIEGYEYGIFETSYISAQPGERIISKNNQPIRETNKIPGRLGVKFGARYKINHEKSDEKIQVKLLYLTPGITNPINGKRQDKIEVNQELSPQAGYHLIAFEFTEESEIAEGEWRMLVFIEDRKLLDQVFYVEKN